MNDLLPIFNKACKRLCSDLKITFVENEIQENIKDSEINFSFFSHTKNFKVELTFTCSPEEKDGRANITLRPNNNTQPFHLSSNQVQQLEYLKLLMDRWVSWALYRYFTSTCYINLNGMFGHTSVRAYGYPFFSYPARLELSIFLSGLAENIKKLVIIRFRHVGDFSKFAPKESFLSRYSYAFSPMTSKELESLDPPSPVWFFFLNAGGSDGYFWPITKIEELIGRLPNNIEIVRNDYYIDFTQLMDFVQSNAVHIGNPKFDNVPELLIPTHPYTFNDAFHSEYKKFFEHYQEKNYSVAMRDLRALVQDALKMTCNNYGLTVEKNDPRIQDYITKLIDEKKIDEFMRHFGVAFTYTANKSSHSNYPTDNDLENHLTKLRIMLTFRIGTYIIKYLAERRENWTNTPSS